jgi:sulfite reductase (ferredoxin)
MAPRRTRSLRSRCPASVDGEARSLRSWCVYPEINDVGVTAVRHPTSGEIGFGRVGGGLSTDPHLGVRLDAFVRPREVVPVVRAVAEIFRDWRWRRASGRCG